MLLGKGCEDVAFAHKGATLGVIENSLEDTDMV